jgi:hypothetical protein
VAGTSSHGGQDLRPSRDGRGPGFINWAAHIPMPRGSTDVRGPVVTKHPTRRWTLVVVLAVAFTFAACGEGSSSDGTTLRENGIQMRDGGRAMMTNGQQMHDSGQSMRTAGQSMMDQGKALGDSDMSGMGQRMMNDGRDMMDAGQQMHGAGETMMGNGQQMMDTGNGMMGDN